MTLTLTMIAASMLMSFVVRDSAELIRSKIDLVIYFRDDSVTDEKILALSNRIRTQPDIRSIEFISKQQALELFHRLPINADIKKPISTENNPLPRSLEIKTSSTDDLPATVSRIAAADMEEPKIICDECLSYTKNQATVDRLVSLTRFVQQAGIGLSLFFGLIAIFNVANIIRLTIFARSDEIEIMRYVGASNAFIRAPFVIEGVMYGLLATLITTVTILIGAKLLAPALNSAFSILGIDFYAYVWQKLTVLILAQLAIGLGIGTIVSALSVRRYLRA